jgi:hypothetical protein
MNDEYEIEIPEEEEAPAKSDPVLDLLTGIRTELNAIPECDAKGAILQHLNSLHDLLG